MSLEGKVVIHEFNISAIFAKTQIPYYHGKEQRPKERSEKRSYQVSKGEKSREARQKAEIRLE